MYLTDIVEISVADGLAAEKYEHPHPAHVLGVNSKIELAQAHREIQGRRNRALMADGVTMLDPESITIDPQARIGSDCHLSSRITVTGETVIGSGCRIEPGVCIDNSKIGDGVRIGANAVVSGAVIDNNRDVAPLSRI